MAMTLLPGKSQHSPPSLPAMRVTELTAPDPRRATGSIGMVTISVADTGETLEQ